MATSSRNKAKEAVNDMVTFTYDIEELNYELSSALQKYVITIQTAKEKELIYQALEEVDSVYKRMRVKMDNADSYINRMGRALDPVLKEIDALKEE